MEVELKFGKTVSTILLYSAVARPHLSILWKGQIQVWPFSRPWCWSTYLNITIWGTEGTTKCRKPEALSFRGLASIPVNAHNNLKSICNMGVGSWRTDYMVVDEKLSPNQVMWRMMIRLPPTSLYCAGSASTGNPEALDGKCSGYLPAQTHLV